MLYLIHRIVNKIIYYINLLYSYWYGAVISNEGNLSVTYPLYINNVRSVSFGKNCCVGRYSRIECFGSPTINPKVRIGNNVNINWNVHIGALKSITIEDNVLIGSHVMIIDHNHGSTTDIVLPPEKRELISSGDIYIESNVWIGEGCMILPNVRIGKNSIIGAGSIITKNIPSNSVVVGNPGRVIKSIR